MWVIVSRSTFDYSLFVFCERETLTRLAFGKGREQSFRQGNGGLSYHLRERLRLYYSVDVVNKFVRNKNTTGKKLNSEALVALVSKIRLHNFKPVEATVLCAYSQCAITSVATVTLKK